MEESRIRPTGIKTTKGKEFGLRYQPNTLLTVEYVTGGQIPDVLKQRFTSPKEAEQAIMGYLKRNA